MVHWKWRRKFFYLFVCLAWPPKLQFRKVNIDHYSAWQNVKITRESKLSSFHLEFSFNSIRYICLLFYCLVTFGFLWHKFCFKKSIDLIIQVKSTNRPRWKKYVCFLFKFNFTLSLLPQYILATVLVHELFAKYDFSYVLSFYPTKSNSKSILILI